MDSSEFIGLDVGRSRTGFARGSTDARLAQPLETVPTSKAVDKLQELAEELGTKNAVVGLPRNLKGDDTEQTAWVRDWVDKAKEKTGLTFYAQDEALTSKLAEARQLKGKALHDTDALAAAIILQDFLDAADAERVVW